jgi:hypothetical protein
VLAADPAVEHRIAPFNLAGHSHRVAPFFIYATLGTISLRADVTPGR